MVERANRQSVQRVLKQRVITAAILIPLIVISILYIPSNIFSLLLAFFVCIAAWEWSKFVEYSQKIQKYIYVLSAIFLISISYIYRDTLLANSIIFLGATWWLCAAGLIIAYQKEKYSVPLTQFIKSVIGLLILVPAWMSLIVLHAEIDGPHLVLFLFILIWLADTTAYFVGKQFGKRRLASRTSPGKSWEGVIGALFATSLLSLGYGIMVKPQYAAVGLLALCIITVMFSIIGDLTESMFKRIVGIKDSGGILPGHGGVLDRIDSLTAAAPIYVMGLWLLQGRL